MCDLLIYRIIPLKEQKQIILMCDEGLNKNNIWGNKWGKGRIICIDRFYARVPCGFEWWCIRDNSSEWMTIFLQRVFFIFIFFNIHLRHELTALFNCCMAGATWKCCRHGASSVYTIIITMLRLCAFPLVQSMEDHWLNYRFELHRHKTLNNYLRNQHGHMLCLRRSSTWIVLGLPEEVFVRRYCLAKGGEISFVVIP